MASGTVAQIARIAHVDGKALTAFHRRRHGLAAECGGDGVLHVLHHDAVTRQRLAVRRHVEIIAANAALGIRRRRARNGFQHLFDLLRELVDLEQDRCRSP